MPYSQNPFEACGVTADINTPKPGASAPNSSRRKCGRGNSQLSLFTHLSLSRENTGGDPTACSVTLPWTLTRKLTKKKYNATRVASLHAGDAWSPGNACRAQAIRVNIARITHALGPQMATASIQGHPWNFGNQSGPVQHANVARRFQRHIQCIRARQANADGLRSDLDELRAHRPHTSGGLVQVECPVAP